MSRPTSRFEEQQPPRSAAPPARVVATEPAEQAPRQRERQQRSLEDMPRSRSRSPPGEGARATNPLQDPEQVPRSQDGAQGRSGRPAERGAQVGERITLRQREGLRERIGHERQRETQGSGRMRPAFSTVSISPPLTPEQLEAIAPSLAPHERQSILLTGNSRVEHWSNDRAFCDAAVNTTRTLLGFETARVSQNLSRDVNFDAGIPHSSMSAQGGFISDSSQRHVASN
jgi:hypothetical protein